MFEFIKDVSICVKKLDKMTNNNRFATNPFSKIVNQTYVWTEKESLFNSFLKNKYKKYN